MTILANGLDTRYITSVDLSEFFINKSTGQPLANGQIFFYQDASRTTPKPVYQLSYNSMTGLYAYVALPNPLTLSATGTFDDGNNNNIPIYYFPYDSSGNLQLYYVVAYDSNNLLQFTRDAWPFPSSGTSSSSNTTPVALGLNNIITDPQFAIVNFTPGSTLSISYTTGTTSVTIAPGWVLNIVATASGTLTVAQTPVAGSSDHPFNPPFLLTVTPGSFITSLTLVQTFNGNPNFGAPQTAGVGGYISGSILLAPNSTITMNYVQSAGTPITQTILTQTNTTGAYTQFNATVELAAANSPDTGLTGSTSIQLVLSNTLTTSFSNVQAVLLGSNATVTTFDQLSVNQQINQTFYTYLPQLKFKPISSYLVGWDFPLNPAQFLGASVAAQAIGANKSYYAWDQTIIFQTATSGVTISRDATGALKILAALAGQHAIVQYLPAPVAIEMLSRRKCVNLSMNASVATDVTVSLWYTKTTLPSTIGSNASIVATLDANGYPATQNSTWFPVPRSGLSNSTATPTATNAAQLTIAVAPSGAANFNQYPLSGWDMAGNTEINSATFFAIVVGTASLAQNAYMLYQDVSTQDGDIPTVSAPKTSAQVLQDCQQYGWTTYNPGVAPGTSTTVNSKNIAMPAYYDAVTTMSVYQYASSFELDNPVRMSAIPTTITFYNLAGTTAQVFSAITSAGASIASQNAIFANYWTLQYQGVDRTVYRPNTVTALNGPFSGSGSNQTAQGSIAFHVVVDGRLGQ